MTSRCGSMSTRGGIGCGVVTGWRISLPVCTVSCVVSGEMFRSPGPVVSCRGAGCGLFLSFVSSSAFP